VARGGTPSLCSRRDRRVRRIVSVFVVALVAAGCGDLVSDPPAQGATNLLIRESPSPFQVVSAGPVTAMIPDAWRPQLAGASDDPRHGLVAGPRPAAWEADRPPIEGNAESESPRNGGSLYRNHHSLCSILSPR